MRRQETNRNIVSYEEEEKEDSDFLRKISSKVEKEELSFDSKDAEQRLLESDYINQGRIEELTLAKKEKVGHSQLSPFNEVNQKTEPYISPFDDAYLKEENEEENEDIVIENNRRKCYLAIVVILYAIFLIIGYRVTGFSDGIPQEITMEDRYKQDYMGKIDAYVTRVQTAHAEINDDMIQFEEGVMSSQEVQSRMAKQKETLAKVQQEAKDIIPPSSYESFHSRLQELYTIQIGNCDNFVEYAKNKTKENREAVKASNETYEKKTENFLHEYNSLFLF